jgi:hypothetical protein
MLTVTYAECHMSASYAECSYAEGRYAECRSAITKTHKSNLKPQEQLDFAAPINYARKIFIKSTTGFSLNLHRIDLKRRDRARLCMLFQA